MREELAAEFWISLPRFLFLFCASVLACLTDSSVGWSAAMIDHSHRPRPLYSSRFSSPFRVLVIVLSFAISFPQGGGSVAESDRLKPDFGKDNGVFVGTLLTDKSSTVHLHNELEKSNSFIQTMQDQSNPVKLQSHRRNEEVLVKYSTDADWPNRVMEKIKVSRELLSKAKGQQSRCEALMKRLKASLLANEEEVSVLKEEGASLNRLAARTMPRGLHCLSLQLTIQYFNQLIDQVSGDKRKLEDPELYHYVVYSENVLAASVVVNSTVFYAKEPRKHVFHILTDALNYPAIKMWFRENTPTNVVVEVKSIDDMGSGHVSYLNVQKQTEDLQSSLPASGLFKMKNETLLNALASHLQDLFPNLEKVVLLDDDVVARKDLGGLWTLSLENKVVGAVRSFKTGTQHLDGFLHQPTEVQRSCINVIDLGEWRKQNHTKAYEKILLTRTESEFKVTDASHELPSCEIHTLDDAWHVVNLDDSLEIREDEIRNAAAVHYSSYVKPWLEFSLKRYKAFWTRFVNYDHPLLQECNINK